MTLQRLYRGKNGWAAAWMLVLCGALAGGMGFQGCATQRAIQVQQAFVATQHRTIRIAPCIDRSGFTGERNLAAEATGVLTAKLQALQLFEITPEAPLVITCDIERFEEGSAFKRWLAPGQGATQAAIAVMVWETPAENVLATFRSQSTVKGGGLYTIGADQYILSVAIDDVVKQLAAWVHGMSPQGGLRGGRRHYEQATRSPGEQPEKQKRQRHWVWVADDIPQYDLGDRMYLCHGDIRGFHRCAAS